MNLFPIRTGHQGLLWFFWLSLLTGEIRAQTNSSLPVLTNAAQILNLSPLDAERAFPVRIEGVITCYRPGEKLCFVQDSSAGIYFETANADRDLKFQDHVIVEGVSGAGSFAPIIYLANIRRVGNGVLPLPKRVSIQALSSGKHDSQWVELEAIIHSQVQSATQLRLSLVLGVSRLEIGVFDFPRPGIPNLVDARVLVRGVVASQQNAKRQLAGFYLVVPSLDQIEVVEAPQIDPFGAPARTARNIMAYSKGGASEHLVRVQGIVMLQTLGQELYIKDETGGIRIQTSQQTRLHPGDEVEASGFPARGAYSPYLQDASFRLKSIQKPSKPITLTPSQALSGEYDNELIQIEGDVIAEEQTAEEKAVLLSIDKQVVRAWYSGTTEDFRTLPVGSHVQITGICQVRAGSKNQPIAFSVYLRSPSDVLMLKEPTWWEVKRLIWVLVGLLVALLIGFGWVTSLNQRVRERTKRIQRRETALEDRYRDLFQNANDIIYTHDLSGKLTSLNKAGERMLGYTENEAKQRNIKDLLAPQQHHGSIADLEPALVGVPEAHREIQFISKDGTTMFLEVTSRPQFENEKLVGVQGIARDITERKKAETDLRRSEQQLRSSLEERERIGRDLHDSIIQSIYAIGLNIEDCRQYIREESPGMDQRLRKVLGDLNAVIREVRNFIVGLGSDDLKGLEFKTALKSLILTLGETHSARFSLNIDSRAAESLSPAQATQLVHIAREGISNAVRHAKAVKTTLSLHKAGNQIQFEIRDDGVGFNMNSAEDRGYGLRNMAVRADNLGASFRIISQVGEGTRIVLDIPQKTQHQSV